MQGLPLGMDFTPLMNRYIEMLRITKFHVHFLLNDDKPKRRDVWIDAATTLIFTETNKKSIIITDLRTEGGVLCRLLGLTIEKASRRDDGGLLLELSTGVRLEVLNDYPNYESVIIHVGKDVFVG